MTCVAFRDQILNGAAIVGKSVGNAPRGVSTDRPV
jgi:hypothetical protein